MAQTLNSLAALKQVRDTIKEEGEKRRREQARQKAEKIRREKDAGQFAQAMASMGVRPLDADERADVGRPKPVPKKRFEDLAPVEPTRLALSDELDATNFIEDRRSGYYKQGLSPDLSVKLVRGEWPVSDTLDLHGFTVDKARDALAAFLVRSVEQQRRCVAVIHGRGFSGAGRLSVLVPRWIKQAPGVMAYSHTDDMGAIMILLHVRKFDDVL